MGGYPASETKCSDLSNSPLRIETASDGYSPKTKSKESKERQKNKKKQYKLNHAIYSSRVVKLWQDTAYCNHTEPIDRLVSVNDDRDATSRIANGTSVVVALVKPTEQGTSKENLDVGGWKCRPPKDVTIEHIYRHFAAAAASASIVIDMKFLNKYTTVIPIPQ